jgi:hypothetical protein
MLKGYRYGINAQGFYMMGRMRRRNLTSSES